MRVHIQLKGASSAVLILQGDVLFEGKKSEIPLGISKAVNMSKAAPWILAKETNINKAIKN